METSNTTYLHQARNHPHSPTLHFVEKENDTVLLKEDHLSMTSLLDIPKYHRFEKAHHVHFCLEKVASKTLTPP